MIGENIKRYRNEKKMTQQELADKLYVTAQAVSRWEKNEVEPSIATITKIPAEMNDIIAPINNKMFPIFFIFIYPRILF